MNKDNRYELIDFGRGRKLERFGDWVLDRPSPAADSAAMAAPDAWREAHSKFDEVGKAWSHRQPIRERLIECGGFQMPVSPTPFGHVGLFPEQQANWEWLQKTAPADAAGQSGLNLFAYTGASTMAMGVSGMRVAHVDAAKPNVSAAKNCAAINGLGDHPIRYLVDDAAKFVAREVRRGNRYHTIVLDPPAYGHSPKGKAWRLERDLWPLLDDCVELLAPPSCRLLISGHSPQVSERDVVDYLLRKLPNKRGVSREPLQRQIELGRLSLHAPERRKLDAGFFVRCAIPAGD